ncbi:MAG: nucleotidyltransferase family protein [Myxococcota bacterium]
MSTQDPGLRATSAPVAPYREDLGEGGRLLALALRGARSAAEDRAFRDLHRSLGDEAVRDLARRNQVEALVASAMADVLPAGELSPAWRDLLEANEARVEALVDALGRVCARLEDAGCRTAAVESGGVMLGSDLPMRAFCSSDIDLLVDGGYEHVTRRIMADLGFETPGRQGRQVSDRVEYRGEGPDGVGLWISVGPVSFDRKWIPLRHRDRSDAWLERRVPSRRAPDVRVPAPVDALTFVSMHTSLHSFVRAPGFRLHVDVDRVARDNPIDWDAYLDEVRALGVPRRAFVSLAMARSLLDTPIPDRVLDALHPGRLRWAALRRLLAADGVVADGRPKLGPARTVALDVLVSEQGPLGWARDVVAPPTPWLRKHFDRQGDFTGPGWMLHGKRAWELATRWRPR